MDPLTVAAIGIAVQKVKDTVFGVIDDVAAKFGQLKSVILDVVGAFRPLEIELFTRAINDLKAVFGQALAPVVQTVTRLIRQLADYFYNLPESFKELLPVLAKVGLIVGLAATAFSILAGAAAIFVLAVSPIVGVLAILAPILVPLVVILGALALVVTQTEGGARLLKSALAFVGRIFAGLQTIAESAWAVIEPAWQMLEAAFSELGISLGNLLGIVGGAEGILKVIGAVIGALLKEVVQFVTGFIRIITLLVKALAGLGGLLRFGNPVEEDKKSAMGLGTHGGGVTDAQSLYKQIQGNILAMSDNANQEARAEKDSRNLERIADNTDPSKKDDKGAGLGWGWGGPGIKLKRGQ